MPEHDPCPSRVLLVQADLEIERLRAALQAVVDDTEGDLDYVKWQARRALSPDIQTSSDVRESGQAP